MKWLALAVVAALAAGAYLVVRSAGALPDQPTEVAWDRETWDAGGQCYAEYPDAMADPVPGLDDDDEEASE